MKEYVSRLKLDFDPFEPGIASRDFFAGGNRQQLLDRIIERSLYGNTIVTVTGCLGSGKTTLARNFCNSFTEEAVCVLVPATLFMNQSQFLDAVIRQLPLQAATASNPDCIIEQICEFAGGLDLEARALILIIDDAHELSTEVFELVVLLLDRSVDSSAHALLLGESQLIGMLHSSIPSASLDSLAMFELEALGSEETLEYIRFKLANAGFHQQLSIPGGVLGGIHNASNGMPGTINALMTDALATEFAKENSESDRSRLYSYAVRYWVVAVVLALMMFSAVIVWDSAELIDVETAAIVASSGNRQIQIPLATEILQPAFATNSNSKSRAPQGIQTDSIVAIAGDWPRSERKGSAIQASAGDVSARSVPVRPATENDSPITAVAATTRSNFAPAADTSSAPTSLNFSEFEQELLSYPAGDYTVQLLGSHTEASVQQFVAAKQFATRHGYFETQHQNRPWYVVVLGHYENRHAATRAIQNLPESLRSLQPWVRNMDDIQADIRRSKSPY